MLKLRSLAFAALLLACHSIASAWSYKEHIQLTRLAAQRTIDDETAPPELRQWLRDNVKSLDAAGEREWVVNQKIGINPDSTQIKGLLWWACVPDIRAGDKQAPPIAPFGATERLMHFIDLEYFVAGDAKREYAADLSSLPPIDAISRDFTDERFKQAGYLPFATQRAYDNLVKSLREKRFAPAAGQVGDDHALRWAGFLAHYTQDNFQPQHATMDYKSASYFGGKRSAPNVHAEVEYMMLDDKLPFPQLREDYWNALQAELAAPTVEEKPIDIFTRSLEISREAYAQLPLIGRAAVAASGADGKVDTEKFYRAVDPQTGKTFLEIKTHQQAQAILRTESLLRRAWDEAQTQPK